MQDVLCWMFNKQKEEGHSENIMVESHEYKAEDEGYCKYFSARSPLSDCVRGRNPIHFDVDARIFNSSRFQ